MNERARGAIASYPTCQKAERAVGHLPDQGFPVADEGVRLLAELLSGTGTSTSSGAWTSSRPRSGPAVT
ncbi:hypothetical protein GCM10009654_36340 [Streptomyces hebeiensis]|uniref:Uncharacterized protein n=1 Tax=Streptomyces hebeiensis TaxID=229486 RepID=A0ABN1UWH6_9ACTN